MAAKLNILWKWRGRSLFSVPNGVEWRDPDLFQHSQFADRLLEILSNKRILKDSLLRTFTQEHVCLKNVKIDFDRSITEDGLQVLSHHKLISLDIIYPRCMNIPTVLRCIGNKSYENLQHLVLHRYLDCEVWPRGDDLCGQSIIETLSRFNYLKTVDISDTGLSNADLAILGKSLLHVENLNLSRNYQITDVSPLKNCQKTLKSLSLGRLKDVTAESAMAVFMTLTSLAHLDVSLVNMMLFDSYSYRECDSFSHEIGLPVFTADTF